MAAPQGGEKSPEELHAIVLAVEELLGGELSGEELSELVNAANATDKKTRND